jgi:hypothetical protein
MSEGGHNGESLFSPLLHDLMSTIALALFAFLFLM